MKTNYRNEIFRELTKELIGTVSGMELYERTQRAERVMRGLDDARMYEVRAIQTEMGVVPSADAELQLKGSHIRHDLQLLIEELSDSIALPAEAAGEPVLTLEELSRQMNVSTKTVTRWRKRGLTGRRFTFNGHKRLGFLRSSVDHFVRQHSEQIDHGPRFRPMTEEERTMIVEQARQMASNCERSAEIIKQLSRQTGRSAETIRHTLKRWDEQHPNQRIFRLCGAIPEDFATSLYQQFRRGVPVDELAHRSGAKRTQVEKAILQMRYDQIQTLPLEYMPNAEFERRNAAESILVPFPANSASARKPRRPSGLPSYLASLYEVPLLTTQQEQHLFRKYNYLKYRAAQLRERLDSERPAAGTMDEIESLYGQAVEVKNQLIQANLRLVVSIAKGYVSTQNELFDLISDGNISLMRAVEKFDFSFGYKFSTYATWAIKKNFARMFSLQFRQLEHFQTSHDEMLASQAEHRGSVHELESTQSHRVAQIKRILARLNDRERMVIASRFGLAKGQEPQTLKDIGAEVGVSKERIRQIETIAMGKLRAAAREYNIESPALWN